MPIPLNPKIVWIRDIDRDENGVPNAFRTERNTLEARRVFAELNRAVGTGSVIRVERRGDGYGLRYDRRLSDAELLRLESILRAKWIIQDPPVPPLKFSMALDWHITPSGRDYTDLGQLVFLAKRRNDPNSRLAVAQSVASAVALHAALSESAAVVAAPSSRPLAASIAEAVGRRLEVPVHECTKLDPTRMQIQADDDPNDPVNVAAGNIQLPATLTAGKIPRKVLVCDDLYSTGSTIAEVAHCLGTLGVRSVYSVTATKTARHQRQT